MGKHPRITTWINGLRVSVFDAATYAREGFDREAVFRRLGREGHIGLQVHPGGNWPAGAKCRWKNIAIREL